MPLWYAILACTLFVICGVAWILFGRLTMGRIERDIKAENRKLPASWDSIGFRVFGFARAVVFGDRHLPAKEEIMVDADLIRRFSKPRDRLLGIGFLISTYSFVAIVLVGIFLFDS